MSETPIADELSERSKLDNSMIAGCEIRAAIQELRYVIAAKTEECERLKEELQKSKEHDHEACKSMENRAYIWKDRAEKLVAENKRLKSKAMFKGVCTDFFYWWFNQPGTNTLQGFDEWWHKVDGAVVSIEQVLKGCNDEEVS
jgi:hypothetical protein